MIEYKPLLDKAIEMSKHKPSKCIIFNRKFGVGKDLQDSTMYGRDFEMVSHFLLETKVFILRQNYQSCI